MKKLLNIIADNVNKSDKHELSMRIYSRDIYFNSKVYEEDTMVLVFLIETDNWFKQTLRFEIKVNTMDSNIYYKRGYGEAFNLCQKVEYKKVIGFILKEIFQFQNNNKETINLKNII